MIPLLVMGAVSIGSQLLSGMSQKKTAKAQEQAANAMARERNLAILKETARNIGEVNRQRTVLNMQTNQALFHIGGASGASKSDLSVLDGVTDSIGSTSRVLLSDVERQEAEAKATTLYNLETEQLNLNSSLESMINSSISQYSGMQTGAAAVVQRNMMAGIGSSIMQMGASAYTQGLIGGKSPAQANTISPVGTQGLQLAMASKR